ncbi:MAG: restriction endonuclease subunit S [Bryobacteraceae bacterium]
MADKWRLTTLGQLTDFLSGGTPSKDVPDYWGGTVPWVSAKDMKQFRLDDTEDHVTADGVGNGTKLVPAGTVLLLVRGMTLLNDVPICVTGRPMTFNQDVKALRPNAGVRSDFLSYLLLGNKERLLGLVDLAGHGTGRLNSDELRALDVVLPPEPEQCAISRILTALDDKIELNRRTNATLESIARAIFKSWFVDFDPVRAKAEGRRLAGMDAETAALFPARFNGSDAGSWTRATVSEVAEINGWTLSERDDLPRIEYVEISGVMKGDILKTTWYDRRNAPNRARRRLRRGDTVLSTVRPDRGAYFLALHPHEQMIASTGFAVITPRSVPWSFLYCAATRKEIFEHLGAQADGGAYPAVSPEIIGKWELWLPANSSILGRFHSTCAPLLEQAEADRRMSQTLAELRDALLPKLLSGAIRIRDAEKVVEEHV